MCASGPACGDWPGPTPIPGLEGRALLGLRSPGWGLGAGGAPAAGAEAALRWGRAGEFERKARAGPRRTLAGFLTGLWQYVSAGRGHLAALNRGGGLRGRVAGWLGRARGCRGRPGAGGTSRLGPWVARPSPGRWRPRDAGDRVSPPCWGGLSTPSPLPGTRP